MNQMEFIKQHLIEKGIPADLTKNGSSFLYRFISSEEKGKPLVFQSPITVFIKEGFIFGLVWGLLMWVMIWRFTPDKWVIYLISSLFFGLCMGGYLSLRIVAAQKKLGNVNWEDWCRKNYDEGMAK